MDIPSEAEMSERLAKLKGFSAPKPTSAADQRALLGIKTDTRSNVDQSHDLIGQAKAEVELDAKRLKPEDEIAERLAKLKGEDYVPPAKAPDVDPSKYLQKMDVDPVAEAKTIQDLVKVLDDVSLFFFVF